MIIIEGPDGSGKTHLINLLKERGYTVPMQSSPKMFKSNLELLNKMIKQPELPGIKVAFDRICVLSELVYGVTLRGKSRITLMSALNTLHDLFISNKGGVIIFMDSNNPNPPLLNTKPWKDEELVKGVTNNYIKIRGLYTELHGIVKEYFEDTDKVKVIRFVNDFKTETINKLLEDIICVES